MAKSLREALKEKGLVDERKAKLQDDKERAQLRGDELASERRCRSRGYEDHAALLKDERYHRGAAREGRNVASRVGTRAYYDRFKTK